MKKLIISIFLFASINCFCQITKNDSIKYLNKVMQLYLDIQKESISIEESYLLFGNSILEIEDFYFLIGCKKKYSQTECLKKYNNYFAYKSQNKSLLFKEIKKKKNVFFQDLGYDSIISLLKVSNFYFEDIPGQVSLDLVFSNGYTIYFYLNTFADEQLYISNIFLTTGESFFDFFGEKREKSYFSRIGIIDDLDGFTNIRKKPDKNSEIVSKINSDEILYYTPNSKSNWWVVRNLDGYSIIGYIDKSKIKSFGSLNKNKKELLKKKYKTIMKWVWM